MIYCCIPASKQLNKMGSVSEMIDEDVLKATCQDVRKFQNHYKLKTTEIAVFDDEDSQTEEDNDEEKGQFSKCTKCNKPTICHKKPINNKCDKDFIDDDDVVDIERIIRDRAEFKTMEIKCVTNLKKNLRKKEKDKERKCNVCEKLFKTEENLEKHRRVKKS